MKSINNNLNGPILELDNIYKTYKLGNTEVEAVKGISLSLQEGEFISIMGPSGSGKTTLLNLIGALDKPTKGVVYINGDNVNSMSDKDLTQLRRNKIGFVFQFYNLIPVLTCYENIELPLFIAGISKKERKLRVENLLKKMGLEKHRNHRPSELSGGQQQRVAIARALMMNPKVILADEPTGNLDTKTGDEILNILENLNKDFDVTVILVTHEKVVAERTKRKIYIKDGVIVDKYL